MDRTTFEAPGACGKREIASSIRRPGRQCALVLDSASGSKVAAPGSMVGRRSRDLLLATGAGLVALVVAESALYLLRVEYPRFYVVDPMCGIAHRPRAHGWFSHEGRAFVRINSDGLRDREHTLAKSLGTLRIAVLGDSYAQALQLQREQGFCSILERELGKHTAPGEEVEVLNFGVASYGTAQELLTLRERVWKYSPDIVLLAMFTQNDIAENRRRLIREELRPYFVLRGDSLLLDDSFRSSEAYRYRLTFRCRLLQCCRDHSRLLQFAFETKRRLQQRWHPARGLSVEEVEAQLYGVTIDPEWQRAWTVTERMLEEMASECARHDARFAVVTLSNPVQVDPRGVRRRALERRLKVPDLFEPERRVKRVGERVGFPVLSLAPLLQDWAREHAVCVHGFENAVLCGGHWNAAGHRLAGTWIADFLAENLHPQCRGLPRVSHGSQLFGPVSPGSSCNFR